MQRLSQDEGINLEGIRRILAMQDEIDDLRARVRRAGPAACRRTRPPRPGSRLFTADPLGGVTSAAPGSALVPRAITRN